MVHNVFDKAVAEMHPVTGMLAKTAKAKKDDIHTANADVLESWLVQRANLLADQNLDIKEERQQLCIVLGDVAWANPPLFGKADKEDLQLFAASIGSERAHKDVSASDAHARIDKLASSETYRGILRSTFLGRVAIPNSECSVIRPSKT